MPRGVAVAVARERGARLQQPGGIAVVDRLRQHHDPLAGIGGHHPLAEPLKPVDVAEVATPLAEQDRVVGQSRTREVVDVPAAGDLGIDRLEPPLSAQPDEMVARVAMHGIVE